MKLKYQDKEIEIADDSLNAKKINQGHDFHLDDKGRIVIDPGVDSGKNKHQLSRMIKKANNIQDIKSILLKVVELIDSAV